MLVSFMLRRSTSGPAVTYTLAVDRIQITITWHTKLATWAELYHVITIVKMVFKHGVKQFAARPLFYVHDKDPSGKHLIIW